MTFDPTRCCLCGAPVGVRCPRCGRPLCHEHRPSDDHHRCIDCELDYARRGPTRLGSALHVVFVTLALLSSWAFARFLDREGYLIARGGDTIYAQFAVYFSFTVAVVGCSGALAWIGKACRRRRFLAETTRASGAAP